MWRVQGSQGTENSHVLLYHNETNKWYNALKKVAWKQQRQPHGSTLTI